MKYAKNVVRARPPPDLPSRPDPIRPDLHPKLIKHLLETDKKGSETIPKTVQNDKSKGRTLNKRTLGTRSKVTLRSAQHMFANIVASTLGAPIALELHLIIWLVGWLVG